VSIAGRTGYPMERICLARRDVYRPGSPQPTEPHGRNCVTSSDPPQLHGAADHEQMTPPQDVGFPASDSVSWPVQADPAAVVPATGTGQTSAVVDNAKSEVGVTDLAQKGATLQQRADAGWP